MLLLRLVIKLRYNNDNDLDPSNVAIMLLLMLIMYPSKVATHAHIYLLAKYAGKQIDAMP